MAHLRTVFRCGGRRFNSWISQTLVNQTSDGTEGQRWQGEGGKVCGGRRRMLSSVAPAAVTMPVRHLTTTTGSSEGDKSSSKKEVTYDELVDLIQTGDVHLIDVREPRELDATGAIPLATNIPLTQVKRALHLNDNEFWECYRVAKPSKDDQNVVFYGLTEVKCSAAVQISNKLGYKKVRHYPGGWQEWAARQ